MGNLVEFPKNTDARSLERRGNATITKTMAKDKMVARLRLGEEPDVLLKEYGIAPQDMDPRFKADCEQAMHDASLDRLVEIALDKFTGELLPAMTRMTPEEMKATMRTFLRATVDGVCEVEFMYTLPGELCPDIGRDPGDENPEPPSAA